MIDATTIPEPVYNIFRVFGIGRGGDEDTWLRKNRDVSLREYEVIV